MMRISTIFYSVILLSIALFMTANTQAQEITVKKINPPFWWTNMHNPELQLMIYGNNIGETTPEIHGLTGITLEEVHHVDNTDYLFLDLTISTQAQPGTLTISFKNGDEEILAREYEIRQRQNDSLAYEGFNSSDAIYLLMPDRFANGAPENDYISGMKEKPDRDNPDGRHGGDIQGIIDHLDYIAELGFTAIWINPLLENDMPEYSYHGYAITDFYKVDARFGSNEDYKRLVKEAHKRGLKVIQDMIFNHCGSHHWMMDNLPMDDWVHQFPEFTRTNYRNAAAVDPHAAKQDKKLHEKGWFDHSMPDLNQENPFVEKYLTQNSIWWIEYLGLNGIRMDTYPFAENQMMARWSKTIMEAYPDFNIVGESWMELASTTAYWQKNSNAGKNFDSHLPSVTDFPMNHALNEAFTEEDGWKTGLAKIYYTHVQDFLYNDPSNNLIFADNHDETRIYSSLDSNYNAFRMAMATLLTTRGIPQIYYGTEILMDGFKHQGDGMLRQDFPGGWPEDERNAFTQEGRTQEENTAYNFLKRLLNWRKKTPAIHNGKLIQYIPEDGIFVYFRFNKTGRIMVILNNKNARTIDTERYSHNIKDYTHGYDVVFDTEISNLDAIRMPAKSARVIELKK